MPRDEHRHAEIKTTKGRRDEEMRRAAEMLADAGFYDDPANNLDLAAMKAQQAKDAELAALRKRVEELEAFRVAMAHLAASDDAWSASELAASIREAAREAAAAGGGD